MGVIHPPITLILKKGTRNSDYKFKESPPNFIRSPFLYLPYMFQGITYLVLRASGGGGGVIILKYIVSAYVAHISHFRLSITLNKVSISNLDWMCLEKWWAREVVLPSNHFRRLKRALALSNSNILSCFRVFYDNK